MSRLHGLQDAAVQLTCNGETLERVQSIKLLGVTMDEHFSWIEHVKALLSSCYGVCAEEVTQLSAIPRSETARRKPDLIEIGLFVCCVSPTTTIPTEATTESPKRMRKFRIRTLRKRPTIGLAPSS